MKSTLSILELVTELEDEIGRAPGTLIFEFQKSGSINLLDDQDRQTERALEIVKLLIKTKSFMIRNLHNGVMIYSVVAQKEN